MVLPSGSSTLSMTWDASDSAAVATLSPDRRPARDRLLTEGLVTSAVLRRLARLFAGTGVKSSSSSSRAVDTDGVGVGVTLPLSSSSDVSSTTNFFFEAARREGLPSLTDAIVGLGELYTRAKEKTRQTSRCRVCLFMSFPKADRPNHANGGL